MIEAGDPGLVHAEGAYPVIGEVALEPRLERALRQPEAALPGAEAPQVRGGPGRELKPPPGVGGEQRQECMGGGGGPQLDALERTEGADEIAPAPLEGLLGEYVVGGGAAHLGGQRRLAAAFELRAVIRVDHGADVAQEGEVALARVAAHRLELVAQHGSEPDGHRRAVDQVEQRQVHARHGLPEPFLAEGPGAKAFDVGHVRMQDERERPRAAGAHAGIGVGAGPARRETSTQASSISRPITTAGTGAIAIEATALNAACVAMTANSEPVRS